DKNHCLQDVHQQAHHSVPVTFAYGSDGVVIDQLHHRQGCDQASLLLIYREHEPVVSADIALSAFFSREILLFLYRAIIRLTALPINSPCEGDDFGF
ncbi:MAG: hypothetical protein WBA90_09175, partial [Albidovulum sp.]